MCDRRRGGLGTPWNRTLTSFGAGRLEGAESHAQRVSDARTTQVRHGFSHLVI